jgi:hypothetical protein
MNTNAFLDILTAIALVILAGNVWFIFYTRRRFKEDDAYIERLEQANDDLALENSGLRQELENQRKRFNTTLRFMK